MKIFDRVVLLLGLLVLFVGGSGIAFSPLNSLSAAAGALGSQGEAISAEAGTETTLPARRLVGHWRLNETEPGPVVDATGNSHGTAVGNPAVGQPGPEPSSGDLAYDFSGGIHGVDTNTARVIPVNGDFTLAVWFRTNGPHDDQGHLFSNNDSQDGRCNLGVTDGRLRWWHHGGLQLTSPGRVDDGAWHLAEVIRQGNHWSLWLDGEIVASAVADLFVGQNRNWFIGRANRERFPFEGWIGEVRVSNYARNEPGLVEHWRFDETELHFTANRAPLQNDLPGGVAARLFSEEPTESALGIPGAVPGSGTAIRIRTALERVETALTEERHLGNRPFTLAFWFRADEDPQGVVTLAGSDLGATATPAGWSVQLAGTTGAERFELAFAHRGWGGGGATLPDRVSIQESVTSGVWHHLALVRTDESGENFRIYLDGSQIWSGTNQHRFEVDSTAGFHLGRGPGGGRGGMTASFDDLRCYDNALSPREVSFLAAGMVWEPIPGDGATFVEPVESPLSWLVNENAEALEAFDVFFGETEETLAPVATIPPGEPLVWTPGDLEEGRTYFWRVALANGTLEGPVWSFTTKPFAIPGIVVNHRPKSSGRYLGSPSLAVLPNGNYIASHDWFGRGSVGARQTALFESLDRGRSWRPITTVDDQYWSNLFWHNGALYLMGTTGGYGQVVIRRSDDHGRTWTNPVDEYSGILLPEHQYHTAPMPVVVHNGRIWRTMEDGEGGTNWGPWFRAFVMSAPEEADLLKASNWTSTNRLGHDPTYLDGAFAGWLEGNVVVDPEGRIVNIPRVNYRRTPERAAIIRISEDGTTATFDPAEDFVYFPGGSKKFVIRPDPEGGRYWTLSNGILPEHEGGDAARTRNSVTLMSSNDLRGWTIHSLILYHPDVEYHGFQYLDWHFDGEDIIAVSRTAHDDGMGGAQDHHDANFMTFHRIENFRGPYPPYPELAPRPRWLEAGRDVTILARASDVESWRWFRRSEGGEDEEIVTGGRFTITVEGKTSLLRIASFGPEDVGEYYPVAENSVGVCEFEPAMFDIIEHVLAHHWRMDDVADWAGDWMPLYDTADPNGWAEIVAPLGERDLVRFEEPGARSWTGKSIRFGGRYDRAILGEISPGLKPFTIGFWFKMNSFNRWEGNQDHILSSNSGGDQVGRWNVHLEGDPAYLAEHGGPRLVFWQHGRGAQVLAPKVEAGQWHHVALVRGSEQENNFRIYLDGKRVHRSTNNLDFTNSDRGVFLARRPSTPMSSGFDGWIDDVRFYHGALLHPGELWGDGYAGWAREIFGEAYGGFGTRLHDSYHGDGTTNFFRYAFDLDPWKPEARPKKRLEVTGTEGDRRMEFGFTARADSAIRYDLQTTQDLREWESYSFGFDGEGWTIAGQFPGDLDEEWRVGDVSGMTLRTPVEGAAYERGFYRIGSVWMGANGGGFR